MLLLIFDHKVIEKAHKYVQLKSHVVLKKKSAT